MAQLDYFFDAKKAIKKIKKSKVNKVALFARSKYLGENEEMILNMKKTKPSMFILGSPKYFHKNRELSLKFIDYTINTIKKHNYKFVGEVLYTHGDKSHGEKTFLGERYLNPLSQNNKIFLDKIKELNIPIMTHWEAYNWSRDYPKFKKLYKKYPTIKFIIPHMAFASIKQIDTILSENPNVYMTISKKERKNSSYWSDKKAELIGEGYLDKNQKIKPKWLELFIKYQDRLMFATDAHKKNRWKKYRKIINRYRKIAKQFPKKVAEKISYKNAEKIYGVKI